MAAVDGISGQVIARHAVINHMRRSISLEWRGGTRSASGATTNGPLANGGGGRGNGRCGAVGMVAVVNAMAVALASASTSSAFIYSAGGGGRFLQWGITQSNSVGGTGNGPGIITVCSPIGAIVGNAPVTLRQWSFDPTAPAGGTWSTSNSFVATVSPAGL